jgi:hypothetical protein
MGLSALRGVVSCVLTFLCPSSIKGRKAFLCLKVLSCTMAVIFPAALFAGENIPGAMLYTRGGTTLNGKTVPRSSALFSGDLVQTSADSVANINATGTAVQILNDSLVQYDGSAVRLEHGGVTISSSKLMAIRAGNVTVSPAAAVWTEFEVRDVDGTVQIAARKGDLTISDQTGTTTLAQGDQTTRDESQSQADNQSQDQNQKKKKKKAAAGIIPGAAGGVFNDPVTLGISTGIVVGGTIWVLVQSGSPVSPVLPQ